MKYIRVPKDINAIKEKLFFNLSKRQALSFLIGAICGFPVYYLTKGIDLTLAVVLMFIAATPALVWGMFERNGLHIEDYAKLIKNYLKTDKIRRYETSSPYRLIEDEIEYERLVKRLKQGGKKVAVQKRKRN
ncbi:MAG: PrgI family protein [Acutalibacteraceae bacterium]|nr:PrgI family protein [Oscillospiraceae bacterium]MEE3403114.1 PrgI family protein [Acutalibacteraceae bacterium]